MADSTSKLPVPHEPPGPLLAPGATPARSEFHISEFAAEYAGGMSPFGDDLEFPLPAETLGYRHPGPENRPHLAGD